MYHFINIPDLKFFDRNSPIFSLPLVVLLNNLIPIYPTVYSV